MFKLNPEIHSRFKTDDIRQIYGEITFFNVGNNCKNDDCPTSEGLIYGYIYTMLYFIFANVLLMNLLVAMFRFALGPQLKLILQYK